MTSARDRGTILPMVFLVVVFLSIVVVGTARYTATNLRYGTVVNDRAVATAVAEAGARYGIARARTNSLTTCKGGPVALVPTASESIVPAGQPTTVTVSCTRLDGGPATLAGWAAVVTGEGIGGATDLLVEQASPAGKDIATGRVMVRTPRQANLRINDQDATFDGDLFYDGSGDGCATIDEYDGSSSTYDDDIELRAGSFVCWPQRWDGVVDAPAVPALPATPPLPPEMVGTCKVFHPGRYTSLALQPGGDNYFRSGVYLFEDVVIDTLTGGSDPTRVLAGYPHDSRFQNELILDGDCMAAQATDGLDGGPAGVTWYLSGSARIRTASDPVVELLPIVHSDGRAVSVHVLGSVSALPSIDTAGGGPDLVQIHGLVWSPYRFVDLTFTEASPNGYVTNGVVAARLRVDATTRAGGWLGPDRTPVEHRLLITSTAEHDGVEVEVQAVVLHRPSAPAGQRVAVTSLRVVD